MASTAPAKKMSMMQLTVVVAVNMMGSGIIMLPTNMAKIGAISLLSWIVTALGSMAIAYGFAQAGIFNQRPGGMAAYAEDAHGKSGYFVTFFLYFFSLAIGNVAIAISAVGYLSGFFAGMSATPIATCFSVIALIWLTTVANFGGPSITGKIGQVTVWGVIIPVAGLSIIGWFWFSQATFAAAWNPNGLHFLEGIDSSIALTLWAFLGMESAAQNSDAVENPKRDVPLACMFGTLGAAVVYILSTTVIQGIVPNAELAQSTGPFALAYAKMFSPLVGSIIMGLAVLACVGSLLGWQFTIGRTAKTAAEDNLFPAIFAKENRMGAPVAGMIVMGVVQTAMALSTISPTLSEQFSALVNLAVVTNVIPYIISLSALMLIMRKENVAAPVYTRNTIIAVIAMVYSTYAIYASGQEAVLGGTIVLALTYLVYGFLATRFMGARAPSFNATAAASTAAIVAAALLLMLPAPRAEAAPGDTGAQMPPPAAATTGVPGAAASTLDRIRESGKITLGYGDNFQPFTDRDSAGNPTGYTVALCQHIVERIKADLGLGQLAVEWVQITAASRLQSIREQRVDLLCGDIVTLTARQSAAFSIPVYPGGIGALLRADAPKELRELLSEGPRSYRPTWRATPAQFLSHQKLAVVAGSPTERWVHEMSRKLKVATTVIPVANYEAGVRQVVDRRSDIFFAERAILLETAEHSANAKDLTVLDRRFTYVPVAIGMPHGDESLRLLVDRALSQLFLSDEFGGFYSRWFGKPDDRMLTYFRLTALPE